MTARTALALYWLGVIAVAVADYLAVVTLSLSLSALWTLLLAECGASLVGGGLVGGGLAIFADALRRRRAHT